MGRRFNPAKLDKLNNPERLKMIPPEYIWKKLSLSKHADKIEIGAGTGLFSLAFQRLSGQGTTRALDISDEMVRWMNENIVPDNPEIIPVLTDGAALPPEASSADLVYMITVHHELDDPAAILDEALRIMRKGASLFIVDWSRSAANPEFGPSAESRCNTDDVVMQLQTAGFVNIEVDNGIEGFFLITAEKPDH